MRPFSLTLTLVLAVLAVTATTATTTARADETAIPDFVYDGPFKDPSDEQPSAHAYELMGPSASSGD